MTATEGQRPPARQLDQDPTWWGSVRAWWARRSAVARVLVVLLVLAALVAVVYGGWFLAHATVVRIQRPADAFATIVGA